MTSTAAFHSSASSPSLSELTSLNWLQNISILESVLQDVPEPLSEKAAVTVTEDVAAAPAQAAPRSGRKAPGKSLERKSESKSRKSRTVQPDTGKPPYSFASLIFLAIEASPSKCLPVKDIYTWIITHFPYYRNASPAWKNSVRHNLSLSKCFAKKGEECDFRHSSKGSLWTVQPESREFLLQQLKKTGAIQAGMCRTVESSRDFWADALKGSGYCGDDESEVVDALIGIDSQDEDRIQLPPRPRSCPPRVNSVARIPSWMVKLRLSPYMVASNTRKIIRSNRVLYHGPNTSSSKDQLDDPAPNRTVPPAQPNISPPCTVGSSSDEDQAVTTGIDAFCRPSGQAFSEMGTGDPADPPVLINRPPKHLSSGRVAVSSSTTHTLPASTEVHHVKEEEGQGSVAPVNEVCEEDHTAAKNLMSLLHSDVSSETAPSAAPGKNKRKSRKPKRNPEAASSPCESEPAAKRLCEPMETESSVVSCAQGVTSNTSSEASGRTSTSSRRSSGPRPAKYLEGVEKGAVGVKRGSRKSIKSSQSAFVDVAVKAPPKPKKKRARRSGKSNAAEDDVTPGTPAFHVPAPAFEIPAPAFELPTPAFIVPARDTTMLDNGIETPYEDVQISENEFDLGVLQPPPPPLLSAGVASALSV